MHCEYCDISIEDLSDARRHMLSVSHIREKRNYKLSKPKFLDRKRQETVHPKTFFELCKLLDLHSRNDVVALNSMGFFKIKTVYQSKLVRELIRILHKNSTDYYINALPAELIEPFLDRMEAKIRQTD